MVSISNDYDNTWVEGVAIKIFIQRETWYGIKRRA